MVKMSTVWDRTVEVINGRTGMLASIAGLTLWLPSVARQALAIGAVGGDGTATAPAVGVLVMLFALSLLVAALAIFGQLALIAVASDPATTQGTAFRVAAARLPLTIGLTLLLGLVVFLLLLPLFISVLMAMPASAAMTFQAMVPAAIAGIGGGTRAFIGLYILFLIAVMIWITVRLILLNPVIVNERAGAASFARSFALTRGLTWKIIGLAVLFAILSLVVVLAVQSVVGIVLRLLMGADNLGLVSLLTGAAVAVVTAGLTVVWTSFIAQLYVALRQAPAGA